jgi:cell division protein FtsI/penicillin-binding protein 2
MLRVSEVIEKSSNIGAAKLAVQLGQERFYGYIRAFGFGQTTGVALPGENHGKLRPREEWTGLSITRIAMGHEVTASPLQVTAATCAIANGGRLLMPKLVHDITDDAGAMLVAYEPQEVRRVITESTAAKLREALIKVTGKKGTASRAHIPGFRVAGKTGTAQKVIDGHYSHDHHVTSFVGFVPAEKPAFCMLVLFDQARVPSNEDVGGLVAAPVFRAIGERALAYLGIEPDPALLQQEDLILAKAGRN